MFQAEFIEGLPGHTFALYLKMHHALVDGASAIARVLASLSEKPAARAAAPFFAARIDNGEAPKQRSRAFPVTAAKKLLLANAVAGKDLAVGLLRKQLRRDGAEDSGSVPFSAPRGPMNEPISGQRSLALLSLPIDEMKAVGRAFGGTLNDVAVTVVDAGLTRYLRQKRKLTDKPLVAMCPVSLRETGDREATTKVSAIFVPLGAPKRKFGQRLEHVITSTGAAKEELRGMSKDAAMLYAIAAFGLAEGVELVRADSVVRPLANFVLSNVPGSRTDRYLGRAKVLGMYPVSALGAGIGLNVTLLSYANSMDFGFVANGASMPDLDELADFTRTAFADLRDAANRRERASGSREAKTVARLASPTVAKRPGRTKKRAMGARPGRARFNHFRARSSCTCLIHRRNEPLSNEEPTMTRIDKTKMDITKTNAAIDELLRVTL